MTSTTQPLRWTFKVPTALGMTHSTYEFTDGALRFESDDPMAGSEDLRWDTIQGGATAAMAGMGGRGGPDLPNWVPAQLEWLVLSRTAGGGKAFMRVLPQGDERMAIVAAVQARLGARWIGERLPVKDVQQRLGITSGTWSTLKVWGIVVAVLASLVLLIMLLGVLLHPVFLVPASTALGIWLCREGLGGLRDGLAVANTPTAKVSSAALGLVELEGRAVTHAPVLAGITGRPSVWWDVAVHVWSEDGDGNGSWNQVAARHGGVVGVVELEDATGTIPIWLPGAVMLLQGRSWESGKDTLPAPGAALLDELGFPWNDGRQFRVSESCLEADQTLYVLGTLDERRNLPTASEANLLERGLLMVKTGQWRRALVGAVPEPARIVVAVLIGYLDMLTQIGKGGERSGGEHDLALPPAIAPAALLVWKGRQGRPFLISNQPERDALAALRRRSWLLFGVGAAVLCFTLYQLVELLSGK